MSRNDAGIRCAARGCWFRRIEPRRPWQGSVEAPAVAARPAYDRDLLPVPRQRSCQRRTQSCATSTPSRSRTISPRYSPNVPRSRSATRHDLLRSEPAAGNLPRASASHLATTCDLGAMAHGGHPWSRRSVGRRDRRARQALAIGAGLREPRRGHGRVEPASARPDLGERLPTGCRRREKTRTSATISGVWADRCWATSPSWSLDGPREVQASEHWLAIVPFWAIWPFETLVSPRDPVARMPDLADDQRDDLAAFMGELVRRYDRPVRVRHSRIRWAGTGRRSTRCRPTDAWRLHAHIYPPLLRSASVRKFMVGYELLAEPQRDLLPEEAAERLRSLI